jgi:zinc transport system substrate-binding protein
MVLNMRPILAASALLLPLLAACSNGGGGSTGISVVTSVYPLTYVAERIGGDHVDVTSLAKPGQEPHDLELGVRETAELTDADLLVYGAGLQPAVDDAVKDNAPGAVVEALQTITDDPPAIKGPRPPRVIEGDPHFWMDPRALATVARAVEDRLSELDPDHADDYRQNASALVADLAELDGRTSEGLHDCERRVVVVSHDAFAYYGYRYDLDFEPVVGLSPESEPSPAHLAELQQLIRDDGITTVFSETLASPKMAETLSDDLGIATAVLDPIEGLSDETADEDYLSLMDADLHELRKANDCR